MKLLFAVDHIFTETPDGSTYTTGGKFPYSAWKSYLSVFDEIIVVSRGQKGSHVDGLARSDGPRVRFVFVPAGRGLGRIISIRKQARAVGLAMNEADCVVARLPCETALLACSLARARRKPCLAEVVACAWDATWNHGSLTAKAYAPIFTWLTRQAVGRAQAARYVTSKFLQGRYPTGGHEFSASNVILSTPGRTREYCQREHIRLGTIGALHTKLKGIDVAMRALAELKAHDPKFSFEYRVLGEGDPTPFRELAYKLNLDGDVYFDGTRQPGADVAAWLDGLDFYLQPSYQEGLPRALIEALNRGLVSVGSTAGGIPELLPPDRLHKPGDSAALARLIAELATLPDKELNKESVLSFRTAQRYTIDVVTDARLQSLKFLASLVSQ